MAAEVGWFVARMISAMGRMNAYTEILQSRVRHAIQRGYVRMGCMHEPALCPHESNCRARGKPYIAWTDDGRCGWCQIRGEIGPPRRSNYIRKSARTPPPPYQQVKVSAGYSQFCGCEGLGKRVRTRWRVNLGDGAGWQTFPLNAVEVIGV